MNLKDEIQAKCVWGEGPRDILLIAGQAFVFGPLINPGHIKEGSGWARVHVDLTKQQAQALIAQLQSAIEETETIEAQVIAHCQGNQS